MANILTQEDDKDKDENGIMTQSGGLQGSSAVTSAPQASAQPKGSGRFTNIQKYLGANQPAGQQLSSGIREKGEDYMGSVREGVESAQNVQTGIQQEQDRLGRSTQLGQQIQDDSVNVAQNNLDEVTKLRLGQNEATRLQGQGQQAQQNLVTNINPLNQFGQNLGTESGRYQVLQDVYGGAFQPNYSTGQRRLDQLFLQTAPGDDLGNLQQEIGQSVSSGQGALSQINQGLGQGIGDIRSGTRKAQQDILGAIGDFGQQGSGAFGSLYSDFGTEQGLREQELQSLRQRAINELSSGNLSQQISDALGFQGSIDVSDLDLGEYARGNIGIGDEDVTMADVAERGDLQDRLNALAALSGTETSAYDLGEKGGSDVAFDYDQFSDRARAARETYEDRFFGKNYSDIFGARPDQNPEDLGTILDFVRSFSSGINSSGQVIDNASIDSLLDPQIWDPKELYGNLEGFIDGANFDSGSTATFTSNPLYNLTDDVTSREQLEQALSGTTLAENAGWIGAQGITPQFQKILDTFDQNRNRTIGVGGSADDATYGAF